MFYFGSPEESAALFYNELQNRPGWPELPAKPVDEMSPDELTVALTYLNGSWHQAFKTGASQAILDVIQDDYDKAFECMCVNDRSFRKFANTSSFVCPGVDKVAAKKRYRAIALSYMTR